MGTIDKKPVARPKNPLINRQYAFLWSGQVVSNLGDAVFDTTLVLWIATKIAAGQSWAPLAVSGVLLSAALPILLVGPFAGVFVDRWNKRRTMLWMDALRALLIALLLLTALPLSVHLPVPLQLGLIYTVVVLSSSCAQFFRPARVTLIGDVVEEADQATAGSLGQLSEALSAVIGPPLAAPLLASVGVQWALLINALSFVASFLAVLLLQIPQRVQDREKAGQMKQLGFWSEFGAGLRFFAQNRILMTLIICVVIVTLGSGSLNSLDVFFTTQNLHASANLYGLLGTGFGLGAILGALLSTVFTRYLGFVRVFWGGLIAGGLLLLLLSRMNSFVPGLIVFFLAAIPIAALNAAITPILLHAAPREYLGRVVSILNPVQALAGLLSVSLSGWLASSLLFGFHGSIFGLTFGTIDTIYGASALLIVLGGVYALFSLRGLHLEVASAASATDVEEKAEAAETA